MATVEEEDLPPRNIRFATVRDMAGRTWEEVHSVEEATSTMVHGRAGQPLWPVVLILGIITAFMVGTTAATVLGVLSSSLLLVYMTGRK